MVRIFRGSCIYIEKSQYDREDIRKKYKATKEHEAVRFVITEDKKIVSVLEYKDVLLKRNLKNTFFYDSEHIWEDARRYFASVENLYSGCSVGVINQKGELVHILEYCNNVRFIEPERQAHFYAFKNYDYAIDQMDEKIATFFKQWNSIVFEELEEYTFHIATLLLELKKKGAEYELYCLDPKTEQFFDRNEITPIKELSFLQKEQAYVVVITDKYEGSRYKDDGKRRCYKSLEIMTLLYGNAVEADIKPKTEKQFVILQDEYINNGLVDLMKHSITDYIIQEKKGNIPIINISKNSTYGHLCGENVWEYFFYPMNEYDLDQAYASDNYKVISRKLMEMAQEQQIEFRKLFPKVTLNRVEQVKRIEWKKEILDYCESELPQAFLEKKRMLGVIARGTDLTNAIATNKNTSIEKIIEITRNEWEGGGYDYIYLATEDLSNYRKFYKEFGTTVISSDQERFDPEVNRQCTYKWIATFPRANGGFEYALDYMEVIYCLSKCESLITSMPSGAYIAATAMNNGRYRKLIIGTRV